MLDPTPRFHVHALALAAFALVLLALPMTGILTPLVHAIVVAASAASLIYSTASFFERGAHILTKLFSGVAVVGALVAGVLALIALTPPAM